MKDGGPHTELSRPWILVGVGGLTFVAAMAVKMCVGRDEVVLSPIQLFEKNRVLVDPRTACQYIRGHQELTPRMGADGKQLCGALK